MFCGRWSLLSLGWSGCQVGWVDATDGRKCAKDTIFRSKTIIYNRGRREWLSLPHHAYTPGNVITLMLCNKDIFRVDLLLIKSTQFITWIHFPLPADLTTTDLPTPQYTFQSHAWQVLVLRMTEMNCTLPGGKSDNYRRECTIPISLQDLFFANNTYPKKVDNKTPKDDDTYFQCLI